MKRTIGFMLGALMLAALCACGTKGGSDGGGTAQTAEKTSQTAPAEEPTAADTQTDTQTETQTVMQTQDEAQIEITPPDGWMPVEGSVLSVQYLKGTASFMAKEEPYFSSTALDDVVAQAKEIFEGSFENLTYVGDVQTITVSGYDAREFLFQCTVAGIPMEYEYVYLVVDGSVYAITFGDAADTFDSLSADYAQILADIQFK